ncbi:hypothetical protein ACFL1V_11080, partial [Pseudomonadota bacterium]
LKQQISTTGTCSPVERKVRKVNVVKANAAATRAKKVLAAVTRAKKENVVKANVAATRVKKALVAVIRAKKALVAVIKVKKVPVVEIKTPAIARPVSFRLASCRQS